jgi:glycosyltransferase involved in cell wall biosynthesis
MSKAQTIAVIAGQLCLGGAERQLYLWLSNLDRDQFRPVVITLHPDSDDYWERPVEALGIDVLRIPRRRSKVRRLAAITRALRSYRPDLVHGWHLFASPYAGAAARFVGARASLGSVRGSFRAYARAAMTASLTDLLTDGLVVNSAAVARQIEGKHRLVPQRVFAVPNAVDPVVGDRAQARSRFAERWKIPDSRIWLASIGRFEKSKQFDLLLEVTASLANEGKNLHLFLIGYGEGMDELKALAKALGVEDRITFTGADAEARFWMKAFDVFCFTSMDEGLPNVVMEAAAAGVPVLAWRTEFLRELLGDGQSAVLVEPGNVRAFRESLHALIENREYRRCLGEAARREVLTNFGVPKFVRRLSAVYEELLGTTSDLPA